MNYSASLKPLTTSLITCSLLLFNACNTSSTDDIQAYYDVSGSDTDNTRDWGNSTSDLTPDIITADDRGADISDGTADQQDGSPDQRGGHDVSHDTIHADLSPDAAPDAGTAPSTTECDPLPVAGDLDTFCQVSQGTGDLVILGGRVLTKNEIFNQGLVVYRRAGDQSRVECVGCDCSTLPGFEDATRIDCPSGAISPGLINPHDHITYSVNAPADHGDERYEHRQDWRGGLRDHTELNVPANDNNSGTAWGELRMVMGGATSIVGSGGVDGLLRNLDSDQEGLGLDEVFNSTFPLGDWSPVLLASGCDYGDFRDEPWETEDACAYLPHIAEGIDIEARNEYLCLSSDLDGGADVISENTAIIHGIGLSALDVSDIEQNGATLIWSPRSNIDLYGNTASVTMYYNMGVTIAMGTDWSATGSMNILRELNCAAQFNANNLGDFFSDHDLFKMVTSWAAEVTASETAIGDLAPGMAADITIFEHGERAGYDAVVGADTKDVMLVLRGGLPLYGDSALVTATATDESGCETLDVCGNTQTVCVEQETGVTLSTLSADIESDAYPLFYCETPENEPSCTPFRAGEYDGLADASDQDGDGIADLDDNCPAIFNPVRPVDEDFQADFDGDGLGDVCDPCPLSEDNDFCPPQNPDDRDGDTVLNDDDNCPLDYNPEQEDVDADLVGDACDLCPEYYNPDGSACAFDITQLRDPGSGDSPPYGSVVSLANLVVTGVQTSRENSYGFYLQQEDGADYSGIYIYTGPDLPVAEDGTLLEPGMRISLSGTWTTFVGIDELTDITDVTISSAGSLPEPRLITPEEITLDDSASEPIESLFVTLESVVVTGFLDDPPDADGAEDEFFIAASAAVDCVATPALCALVGDFFYDGNDNDNNLPYVQSGDTFSRVTGFVNGYGERYSVDIRTLDDLEP